MRDTVMKSEPLPLMRRNQCLSACFPLGFLFFSFTSLHRNHQDHFDLICVFVHWGCRLLRWNLKCKCVSLRAVCLRSPVCFPVAEETHQQVKQEAAAESFPCVFTCKFAASSLQPQWSSANHCLIRERWISFLGLVDVEGRAR